MQTFQVRRHRTSVGAIALALSLAVFTAPLAGCFGDDRREVPPPVDDTRGGTVAVDSGSASAPQAAPGMSGKTKMVILAGAAALYYLYKKSQNAKAESGPDSQYYLSKNGRIYYRDAEGRAHWVTPPTEGIQVPESEASTYRDFQGYDNRSTGMDLETAIERGLESAREPAGR